MYIKGKATRVFLYIDGKERGINSRGGKVSRRQNKAYNMSTIRRSRMVVLAGEDVRRYGLYHVDFRCSQDLIAFTSGNLDVIHV